jgi:DNA-binding transcriptional regulator of glucitol operon
VSSSPTKWFSARAFRLHTTVILVVGACLALGWWQVERALSGNTLSWVYVFEWPFFAGYALFMWWRLLHEQPGEKSLKARMSIRSQTTKAETRRSEKKLRTEQDDDAKLAEYNRYLAELNASDRADGR